MKKLICLILLLFLFSTPVLAEKETYTEQYKASGAEGLQDILPDSAKDFFTDKEINPENYDWVNSITAENIFTEILDFLKKGGMEPLRAASGMFGIVIIYAASALSDRLKKHKATLSYIFMLTTASGVLLPMFSIISSVSSAVKGSATFMTAFIPVYAGILTVGGQSVTASGMSFLLLFAAEAVTLLASFIIVPLMSAYLGMGLVSGIMPNGSAVALGETIKKAALWLFSLSLTVFLGILSIQTAVNADADNAGLKAFKFVLGSLVPVAGSALNESMTTLTSSLKLLKSSVGMYGVLAVGLTALPVVIELLLWRLSLFLVSAVSELFGVQEGIKLFKCADCVLSTLVGILLFTASLFIISLAVVTNT